MQFCLRHPSLFFANKTPKALFSFYFSALRHNKKTIQIYKYPYPSKLKKTEVVISPAPFQQGFSGAKCFASFDTKKKSQEGKITLLALFKVLLTENLGLNNYIFHSPKEGQDAIYFLSTS